MSDKKIYNGFNFFDALRERLYNIEKVKAGKGLKLNDNNTISVNAGNGITFDGEDKLEVDTATETILGGVKVSNNILIEEPPDELVPNVVSIQDFYLNKVAPMIPQSYSNGLVYENNDLRIESVDILSSDTEASRIPTVNSLLPYRNKNVNIDTTASSTEILVYINSCYIDVYANYIFNQPESGNQHIFIIYGSTFNKYNVKPISPVLDQYVGSCIVRHNDSESLELMRYYFVEITEGVYKGGYYFTVKPDNVTDGDYVKLHVQYPITYKE